MSFTDDGDDDISGIQSLIMEFEEIRLSTQLVSLATFDLIVLLVVIILQNSPGVQCLVDGVLEK
jgi:hypothetical protein